MLRILYTGTILLYLLALRLASPFSARAKAWIDGRKGQWSNIGQFPQNKPVIWVHCASLGEFEQARPVLEALKSRYPDKYLLLTFFSPSGYDIRKDYKGVDKVLYLPSDLPWNVNRFLNTIKPEAAIFVKYEFWFNYISTVNRRGIKLYLISAIFRPAQHFFKPLGFWQRKHLHMFTHFFVQDANSGQLLNSIGLTNITVSGDTRADRVRMLPQNSPPENISSVFGRTEPVLVAGSTYAEDEAILAELARAEPTLRFIIAPHIVSKERIQSLQNTFSVVGQTNLASEAGIDACRFLIIDSIGILSSLYSLGRFAYIGGGFGQGIHNTLEAATFAIPLCFGPNYSKFREATELISSGAASSIRNGNQLITWARELMEDEELRRLKGSAARKYIDDNSGATAKIMAQLGSDLPE